MVRAKVFCLIAAISMVTIACQGQKVSFGGASSDSTNVTVDCLSKDCLEKSVEEDSTKTFSTAPNDILFVLDDSVSMGTIYTKIKAGFASLAATEFPNNTRMAVTYMSPDKLNADSSVNFGTAWSSLALGTPGHLGLVSADSIASFLSLPYTPNHDYIQLSGCAGEWFMPNQVNSQGQSCLDSAIQSPLFGTGVEAGLVSLEQTLIKFSTERKRLFRDKAFANIIFVSDTHEPGAAYWGKSGARARQITLPEIQSVIVANSPGIRSIKFSGVLPVPMLGSPYLTNLNVIGPVPQTLDEAVINGENINPSGVETWWDYSYLPVIKGTNGVIAHPKASDWGPIASALMSDANYSGNLVVAVAYKIDHLVSVAVDGRSLSMSLLTVNADGLSININYISRSTGRLNIKIAYVTTDPNAVKGSAH